MEYSINIDPSITTADGLATPQDYRDLHNVAQDPEYTGAGVTIAIVDSGIDTSHPFFADKNVRDGFDATGNNAPHTDRVGHGTWNVTCPLAAFAPDAELYPIRVFGENGRTNGQILGRAYNHLYEMGNEIDIATFALGSPSENKALNRMHSRLQNVDIRDVTSAGNSGQNAGSPATADGAWTIGATDENGKVTNFSSYESDEGVPDVTCIGRNVIGAQTTDAEGIGRPVPTDSVPNELAEYTTDNWMKASGTSVSGPAAAFAAAAWLEKNREKSPLKAQSAYDKTARDSVDPGVNDPDDGDGLLTHLKTIGQNPSPDVPTVTGTVWSIFSQNDWVQLDGDVFEDGEYEFDKEMLVEAAEKTE